MSKKKSFEDMTVTERKIAVCKDVLARMRYRRIDQGYYCKISNNYYGEIKSMDWDESAKKHISKIEKECTVCAIGSCFLSFIRLFNHVRCGDFTYSGHSKGFQAKKLEEVFTLNELNEIEAAFEGFDYDNGKYLYFIRKYETPKNRLRAIMLNIIKNKGKLVV